jgi:hypothetical protein
MCFKWKTFKTFLHPVSWKKCFLPNIFYLLMEGNNSSGRIHVGIWYYTLIALRLNAEFYCTLNPVFLSCFVISAILTVARLHRLTPCFFLIFVEWYTKVWDFRFWWSWFLAPCRLVGGCRRFGEKYLCQSSGKPGMKEQRFPPKRRQLPTCLQCTKLQNIIINVTSCTSVLRRFTSRFLAISDH